MKASQRLIPEDVEQLSAELNSELCNSLQVEPGAPQRHVLFIIDQLVEYGGAERVLLNTIRWLPADRYRCSLLTFKLAEGFGGLQDVRCPLYVWPLLKTYDLRAVKVASRLLRFLRDEKVSLVHTFFETSDLWAAPIAKLFGGVPVVSSRRDMGILRHRKHKVAYRFTGKLYDRVVTVSEQVRKFCIAEDRLPSEKVTTLYNGIEVLDRDDSRSGLPAEKPANAPITVTTVAHVRRIKGIDVLIDVAEQVRKLYPTVRFVVVGGAHEPEYFRSLQTIVENRGLEANVSFAGECDSPADFLADSDIFFLPSRSEGFSNALVEAMLHKLPCVATKVGGNGEAIRDGVTGFLVPPDDVTSAADKICTLIADRMLRLEMGACARQSALRKFTAHAMITGLTKIYDEVLHA